MPPRNPEAPPAMRVIREALLHPILSSSDCDGTFLEEANDEKPP